MVGMEDWKLPVIKRVKSLVDAIDGAEKINEALFKCEDVDAMFGCPFEGFLSFETWTFSH